MKYEKRKGKKQVDTNRMEKCRLLDKIGGAKTNQYRGEEEEINKKNRGGVRRGQKGRQDTAKDKPEVNKREGPKGEDNGQDRNNRVDRTRGVRTWQKRTERERERRYTQHDRR